MIEAILNLLGDGEIVFSSAGGDLVVTRTRTLDGNKETRILHIPLWALRATPTVADDIVTAGLNSNEFSWRRGDW